MTSAKTICRIRWDPCLKILHLDHPENLLLYHFVRMPKCVAALGYQRLENDTKMAKIPSLSLYY